ncbi:hypothetical protein V8B55DRAFT_1482868 [Mucor lusitanicus]|uniref:N-acetyltransferase domain-containing protein n=2 Tax=Mucor circinelloides f. lusitanicus TaxID=29924 RepID=A0A168I0T1_MUCCL|nr:hypothetical protein FB192DRAFT_1379699 [Mucor lusitanicus]OAC99417.1 hypothetical protein MUCCIDRAFT_157205 [Mucor lusitanicus CBS 277.49]
MTHSRPLPSPPDLKIQDYEALNSKYMIEQQQQKAMPLSPPLQPTALKTSPPSSPLPLINDLSQFHALDIIHDPGYCMFRIQLDKQNTAALCYLPTRCKNIVEFYHIEIPVAYRHQGLGDLLLYRAFQWAEKTQLLVIPTCPFVRKYLETRFPDQKSGDWSCIVLSETPNTS